MDNQMQSRVSDGRLLYLLLSPTRLMKSTDTVHVQTQPHRHVSAPESGPMQGTQLVNIV